MFFSTAMIDCEDINYISLNDFYQWFNDPNNGMGMAVIDDVNELQNDIISHNNIINDMVFFKYFMENILIPYYNEEKIIILIDSDENMIYQSMCKFLEVRYGIKNYIIKSIEDYEEFSYLIGTQMITKVFNYDLDFDRYTYMIKYNSLPYATL